MVERDDYSSGRPSCCLNTVKFTYSHITDIQAPHPSPPSLSMVVFVTYKKQSLSSTMNSRWQLRFGSNRRCIHRRSRSDILSYLLFFSTDGNSSGKLCTSERLSSKSPLTCPTLFLLCCQSTRKSFLLYYSSSWLLCTDVVNSLAFYETTDIGKFPTSGLDASYTTSWLDRRTWKARTS